MTRRLLGILVVAILAAACGRNDGAPLSGSIEIDEVVVSARVGGAVTELRTTRGRGVVEGDTLVVLDGTELDLVLRQSEASLEMSEAALETLLEGARPQEILAASAAASAARAVMEQKDADLERASELQAAGALSLQALQGAETAAAQAGATYQAAAQAYSLALSGARDSEIRRASAAVESARASADLAARRLDWSRVLSPLAGTVTWTAVLPGETVSPGTPLLAIADTDTVKAVFYLEEADLVRFSVGDTLLVGTGIDGDVPVEGVLGWISDGAEFTPSRVETREGRSSLVYRAEVRVPNPHGTFKAGMPVDVWRPESS